MTFDEVRDTKPLEERQRRVMAKIQAIPEVGSMIVDTLIKIKREDELKLTVLQLSMGRAIWEEYWAVYKDTIEKKANEVFTSLEKKPDRNIF